MSLDPKLEEIFAAWYEFDHAPDEQTKGLRRAHRDTLIRAALLPHDLRIIGFYGPIATITQNGSSIRSWMRGFEDGDSSELLVL